MTDNVMQLFEQSGAVLHGHFILTSGLHSDTYMQCAKLFEHGDIAEALCKKAADKLRKYNADVIVSPAVGAIIFGYELGKQLGLPNMFAEREKDGNFALRRGFELKAGSKVIIAENVVLALVAVHRLGRNFLEVGILARNCRKESAHNGH